jgi:hypothetical protein
MANQNSAWARGLEPFSFGKVHQNMAIPHKIQKNSVNKLTLK